MSGFEKVKLATGEFRGEYIARRLVEGVSVKDVTAEINAAGFYTGPEGESWPESVAYAEKRKLDAPKAKPKKLNVTAAVESALASAFGPRAAEPVIDSVVPPEYEGILEASDIAEIEAEAKKELRAEQRKQARKDLLAKAKQNLKREAAALAQSGEAKGDMVDVSIDLAPYAADIRIDGVPYYHGTMRRVSRKVAAVLNEQMQRSWQHQDGLSGQDENTYRRQRHATINGRTGAVTGADGLRA